MFGVFSSSASFTESRQKSWRRAAFLLDLAEGKNSQQDPSIATGGRHLSAAGGYGETNEKFQFVNIHFYVEREEAACIFFGSLTCYVFILCPLFRCCLTVACYRTNSRANQSERFRKGAGRSGTGGVVRSEQQRERDSETERCRKPCAELKR